MPLTPSTSSPRPKAAPSTTGEHESPTPSQLDLLAERNERFAAPSLLRRAAPVLAIGGVALLLGALLWWVAQRGDPAAPSASAAPTETAVMAPAVAPHAAASPARVASTDASDVAASETRPVTVAAPAAASVQAAQTQASPPAPAPAAKTAERARKAQVRREAEARAKASSAQAPREPREIDIAATPTAAETRSGAGTVASGAEAASRPRAGAVAAGVREFCAGRGNIVSQLFCQSRECRKPVRVTDPTCVRLKEIEEAQRRVEPQ